MKISIVNDVLLATEALRRVISRDGKHQITWIARDGIEAVEKCDRDRPDLILMDLFMPRMDGIEATRRIMQKNPCAIIIATTKVKDYDAKVFEAMAAGALDAVNIPVFAGADKVEGARELLAKIETIHKLVRDPDKSASAAAPREAKHSAAPGREFFVAIGSSAGGPTALTQILAGLPEHFPAAVVIVQHVDKQFAKGLTDWFATHTKLQVRVAQQGDIVQPGVVYLANGDKHLVLTAAKQLGYTSQPADNSYCPSVDVFFKSVAKHWRSKGVGILLTGMGRDGAEGLKALRDAGHYTIAQDKGSSAVYGMPKAAAELDAAKEILALDKIAPRLTNIVSK